MSGEGEVFDVRQKLKVLRSMIPDCKRYLVPSKIVPDLFSILGEDKRREIVEKERHSRPEAVELLMKAVLAKQEDGLNLFIFALRKAQEGDNTCTLILTDRSHVLI
ncbi:hypothetical protein V1264_014220 [Littorina saxatilis]|uniref:CARD domain-containing protein n=1 Tax=Littorina saxatilis TaxID=31220 RepID=A0AAN9GJI6_9CAEN